MGIVTERLSRERLDTIIRMIVSARGPKVADEIADHIAALEAEVSELLPMADVAGWWQGEFQIANVDRNELRAEKERLREIRDEALAIMGCRKYRMTCEECAEPWAALCGSLDDDAALAVLDEEVRK